MLMKVPQELLKLTQEQERKQAELIAANKRAAKLVLLSLQLQLSSTVSSVTNERK